MREVYRFLLRSNRINRLRGALVSSRLRPPKRKFHVTRNTALVFRKHPFFFLVGDVPDHLFEHTTSFSVPHPKDSSKRHRYKSIMCHVDRISRSPRSRSKRFTQMNDVILDRLHTIYTDNFKGEATRFDAFKKLFDDESSFVEVIWDCEKKAENTVGFIVHKIIKTKFNGQDVVLCKQGPACINNRGDGVMPFVMHRFLYKLQMEYIKRKIPVYGFYTAIYPLSYFILATWNTDYIPRTRDDERMTDNGAGLMSHAIKTFYGIDRPKEDLLHEKLGLAIKRDLMVKEDSMRIKISYLEELISSGKISHFKKFFELLPDKAYLGGYGVPGLFPLNKTNLEKVSETYNTKFDIKLEESEHFTDPFVRKVHDVVKTRRRHKAEYKELDLYKELGDIKFEEIYKRVTPTDTDQYDQVSSHRPS